VVEHPAGVVGAAAIHSFDLEDKVQITAHRGGAGVAPENTLAAIRQAIEDRTDWIEIDVQESKDGVVMVAHDSDLAKVARNPVKIWEATAEELRAIDIGVYFGEEFKGERMPTLEEVLQMCKGRVRVNIELKYYGHTQELENRVTELVERFKMESEIVVMSLESKGIEKVKSLRPDWTVGLLTAVAAGDLTRAKADFLAVNSKLATRGFVQAAHRRNKTVSAWTVNDACAMSAMISRGVDNLITDYPALARQVLAERQQMSPMERLMVEVAFYLGGKPSASVAK
jgi:glycerophosphoryl diester phosphodiesterase